MWDSSSITTFPAVRAQMSSASRIGTPDWSSVPSVRVKRATAILRKTGPITGKVKNISNDTSTAFIHFKFIDKSGEVLGNVDCNSSDLEPGQTQALNCIPDGKYGKYTTVTAEATF